VTAAADRPVTILYLSLYGTIGGAERSLVELCSALDRTLYQPLVVLGAEGPLAPLLRDRGVEVVIEPLPAPPLHHLVRPRILWREVRAALRLRRLARARGVRVLQCGDVLALLLLLPASLGGARVVYQINFLGGGLRRVVLNLLSLPTVHAIVACSSDQRRQLLAHTRGLASRVVVVHPGLDPAAFRDAPRERFRRELGIENGEPLVGMLARYDTWKGHATFLEAAARIRRTRPEVRFVMVGGALQGQSLPSVARYERFVRGRKAALGLDEQVHVIDHRDDVPTVLAGLDVLVCPSVHEPFGMVVIEALAAGTPVVASDSGGPAEIVEDEESGLLFPTGDAEALAARVLRLVDDRSFGRALAAGGRARVEGAFHRRRYARDVERIYARLLGHAPAA
jgi:glycosyltransferase involved in cell wall biosynthesis